MSGLTQRVAAAMVLIPLVVAAVLWLPTAGFALAVALFVLVGAWEWTRIGQLDGPARILFIALVVVSLAAFRTFPAVAEAIRVVLVAGLAWWLLALWWVVTFQRGGEPLALARAGVRFLGGWLVLVPAWAALVWLHGQRPALVLYVLVLIWSADTAAFFVGRRFGRRKLASRVSPGKSWEGVAGGLVAVAALAALAAGAGGVEPVAPAVFVLLSLAVALASVLGDLAESLFKRRAGVKDSGTLIPGHGGVLDRIDSLTAAAPCFALGWMILAGVSS